MRRVDAEKQLDARNRRIGEFLAAIGQGLGAKGILEGVVTRVTVRFPTESQPEALLVVKVTGSQGDFVGFVGGLDVVQAILVWRAKETAEGLKWREDVPWQQR